jgi:PIN domain nuclease of toxin-antitoxin system
MAYPSQMLLDTQVLLWLVSTPQKVAASARKVLADPGTEVVVSAASAWEIAIKTRVVRLHGNHRCRPGLELSMT